MKKVKSFTFTTCIDSCNGMCRRVLNDIEKEYPNKSDLIEAYLNDKIVVAEIIVILLN